MTKRTRMRIGQIWGDRRAMSLIEFAYSFPILMTMIAGGTELANYTTTKMRVSQLALQVADNASRIGVGNPIAALEVRESDINDILTGAEIQAGSLGLTGNTAEVQANGSVVTRATARVMIASLEVMNPAPTVNPANKYYIRWQRCAGAMNNATMTGAANEVSQYGTAGRPSGTNMPGMGPAGRQVTVPDGQIIMFVEVRYRYQPIFFSYAQRPNINNSGNWGYNLLPPQDINAISSMIVRDDRQAATPTADVAARTCT